MIRNSEVSIEDLYEALVDLLASTTHVREMFAGVNQAVPVRILLRDAINLSDLQREIDPERDFESPDKPPTFGNFCCMWEQDVPAIPIPMYELGGELEVAQRVVEWAQRVVGDMRHPSPRAKKSRSKRP